jgi:hypothetical protein
MALEGPRCKKTRPSSSSNRGATSPWRFKNRRLRLLGARVNCAGEKRDQGDHKGVLTGEGGVRRRPESTGGGAQTVGSGSKRRRCSGARLATGTDRRDAARRGEAPGGVDLLRMRPQAMNR